MKPARDPSEGASVPSDRVRRRRRTRFSQVSASCAVQAVEQHHDPTLNLPVLTNVVVYAEIPSPACRSTRDDASSAAFKNRGCTTGICESRTIFPPDRMHTVQNICDVNGNAISDHTSLFLDTGQNSSDSNYNQFKFKLG
jgi:hypothetical protein